MIEELDVVCVILHQDNKVLIAKRSSTIANEVWEFPGGKVEIGESKEEACVREIQEELSLVIRIDDFVCDVVDTSFQPHIHVYAYVAHIVSGEIALHAHSTYKWIHPSEIFTYAFQEADDKIKQCIQTLS